MIYIFGGRLCDVLILYAFRLKCSIRMFREMYFDLKNPAASQESHRHKKSRVSWKNSPGMFSKTRSAVPGIQQMRILLALISVSVAASHVPLELI